MNSQLRWQIAENKPLKENNQINFPWQDQNPPRPLLKGRLVRGELSTLGFPQLLGSLWATIPVVVSILIILIRTNLEDATLINELTGYREYSLKNPYKLIPKVW